VTSFSVLPSALGFWLERFVRDGVPHEALASRGSGADAERVLAFRDRDGAMYELVGHPAAEARPAWTHAPGVPAEHAIHGFHSVTLWVEQGDATERVLVDLLGFRALSEHETTRRYTVGESGPSRIVDVRSVGGFMRGAKGAGIVHHVAFEVRDDASELALRERVVGAGLHPTEVRDRNYFRSVYFREPGGVLFELATSGPGFTVDEPSEMLGQRLMLPSQFEPRRAAIEAVLPPIHLPVPATASDFFTHMTGPEDVSGDALGFVHRYLPPTTHAERAAHTTLLLLHGTGGDEDDLIPLGRSLLPGAGILSPRGKVLEGGAPRFFRRIAPGVFDLEDLARQTEALASFVDAAATTYRLDRDRIIAVGFSNGANIAASLLLRRPEVLRGAALLRPMLPYEPEEVPQLRGTDVLVAAGEGDPYSSAEQTLRLAEVLREGGAEVTVHTADRAGHSLTRDDLVETARWMAAVTRELP
jgi:predicted esterase/catechol 2,3-dioxygenase-like lactoylglutathione lyase family enzyme